MGERWNWTVAPGAGARAAAFIGREDDWFPPKLPLRENRVRALAVREGLFCKWFKARADQAAAEWRGLTHLAGAGLPVP
ncbi:MAG: hypothetical protein HUU15_16845, partial [Candidatus Brocadiae bacterium]|nr:hypothetical protein [Candidatus Brocadiia bacterium]